MVGSLDVNNGVPLYQQLTQILRDAISDGTLPVDSKIPTEAELGEQYGISRITVRNAIDELVSEGLVIKRQGKGTYVAPNKNVRKSGQLPSFTRTCKAAGRKPSSRVIRLAVIPGAPNQTRFFQLADHASVIHIQRVLLADNIPVILETNVFSASCDFLLRENLEGSLYGILKKHSIIPTHHKKTVNITYAGEVEQKYLEVELGKPLLMVDDYIYDQQYKPLHASRQIIRSELFAFHVEA